MQGDLSAMSICALGLVPLICAISTIDARHAAYADDISCG